jgi:hypothetical protein
MRARVGSAMSGCAVLQDVARCVAHKVEGDE